ncbi:MAG: nuclear transport factor 2 family protein [Xanthomonadales bacterium]|nr:nuclear transport factor 2 family protein [Xanthomonadales bacterium]NNK32493.1 nuclear transport factor 2 family protein [Xanthomonadales bacterium]
MSERAAVDRAIGLYFEGMNGNDAAVVALTDDVVFTGPMQPEPLTGEAAVRQHISEIAPFVARMDRKQTLIDGDQAAVVLEFEGLNGVVIEGVDLFRVRDGRICFNQSFFDTRPLLAGAR